MTSVLNRFTKYDALNTIELKKLFTRRYGTNSGKKLPLNRNMAGYKYREFFIQEDLKNGIDPYLPSSVNLLSVQLTSECFQGGILHQKGQKAQ